MHYLQERAGDDHIEIFLFYSGEDSLDEPG